MAHEDGRKLSRSAQDAVRRKAVKAVVEDGMPQIVAARVFGVSKTTVCLWVKAYRQGGWAALESKPKGRPKGGKLTQAQEVSIRKSVLGKNPNQLRLPGPLWTRDLVGELIQRRFGVRLSRWTVGRYLKRWGLTPQKPARRALEQNPAQVKYWLETKYPAIERQAKEEGARIWWGDETGRRSDHQSGTTWSAMGQTPLVKVSGNRFSCNMISAVTNRGDMSFMIFEGRFSTKTFLVFLKLLVKQQAGRKVFIIVDRHPGHKAKAVEKWIAAQEGKVRLFFLPAYSPELNPDELVNQDVKSSAFRQEKAKDKSDLMRRTRSFMRSRQRRPERVKRYFLAKYVAYARAA
jgi:transposase